MAAGLAPAPPLEPAPAPPHAADLPWAGDAAPEDPAPSAQAAIEEARAEAREASDEARQLARVTRQEAQDQSGQASRDAGHAAWQAYDNTDSVVRDHLARAEQATAEHLDDALALARFAVEEVERRSGEATQTGFGLLPRGERDEEENEPYAPAAETHTLISLQAALWVAGAATAASLGVLWLGGGFGTAGGTVAASKAAGTGGRRILTPVFSPLFTRFEGRRVLEHPNRAAIYTLIATQPGIRLQDLCDETGLSRTATTHHLRLLEGQHLVVSRRVGRSRHYFENGGRYGRDQKEAYAVLQNERSRAVARFIHDHPGVIQKSVCQALGLPASIAHWHVTRLRDASLVETVRSGRTVRYFPAEGMAHMRL